MPNQTAATPAGSTEALEAAQLGVRELLQQSEAFAALDEDRRKALAQGLVQIATHLESVDFPEFVSSLIDGVCHSIVQSSTQQMQSYARLVSDVAKSLNQFRDDNTTQNQGRDHLVEQFPEVFQLTLDTGNFGDLGGLGTEQHQAPPRPRVRLRNGVEQRAALARINRSLPLEKPVERLDDELVEAVLVPAARTQLASGRQQLLATMVMLGINRMAITDGPIQNLPNRTSLAGLRKVNFKSDYLPLAKRDKPESIAVI